MGVERLNAKFSPGDAVTVRPDSHDGHHRTPWFIKGKSGRVHNLVGAYFNPESRAYGGDGIPKQPLYAVEFDQREIWASEYRGQDGDTLLMDIYEHWLTRAN